MIGARRRVTLVVVFCLLLFLAADILSAKQVLAAGQPTSLTTSPVSLDLQVKPGSSLTKTLQVMDNDTEPLTINMQLQIFGAYGNTGEASIYKAPANDPSTGWVHFSPSSFVAQPGVWASVQMKINLPASASLGYYYAVIFHPNTATPKLGKLTNVIKGSNAVLVLVDTGSANESRQVQIASFSVSKHIYEYLPATFTVNIHNAGNIYLAPTGNIFISKNSNLTNTIDTLTVNPGRANILPDSHRIFTATWSNGFPVFEDKKVDGQVVNNKQGKPIQQLVWNFADTNKFRFGEYYAQVTLTYNNGTFVVPLTGVVSFWVLPWKLMIVAFLVLVLLGLGFWSVGRSVLRRIRKVRKK
ncbi:MAG TPA: hypothetical protein VMR18_00415 [Candidatus Saccharimonadales bacterium]|jgi:hypothetical protein|nr:hypothetical protein [Candidatus Saccharimonadales bacterium]